jgi:Putative zinc-binding metallo-peptidase
VVASAPKRRPPKRVPWGNWSNDRLLDVRLCDLGVSVEGSWLQELVDKLHSELDRRHIRCRPHVWLSDEWFSPDGIPGIAVPFYLAHPRLMRLERSQMLEVEGGTSRECMRILRHETGHALQHAYDFHRRRRWQQLFGRSTAKYPEFYRPNPASKRYVQHLRLWYAQSHPDEDFAETFAVWLSPRSNWRTRYAGWPALKKLEYVDQLMREMGDQPLKHSSRARVDSLPTLRGTLRQHYQRRHDKYALSVPDTWDRDLRQLFSDAPRHRKREAASTFLRRNRSTIRKMVARWTGEYQVALDMVLQEMIDRCRELRLRAVGRERDLVTDFAVLLTVRTMHFLYSRSGREWIPL